MRIKRPGASDADNGDGDASKEGPRVVLQVETRRVRVGHTVNSRARWLHSVRQNKLGFEINQSVVSKTLGGEARQILRVDMTSNTSNSETTKIRGVCKFEGYRIPCRTLNHIGTISLQSTNDNIHS